MLLFKRIFLLLGAAIGLMACAQTVTSEDGTTRITGFVSITVKPTEKPETFAGQVTDVRSLGLTLNTTPSGSGMTFGFSRLLVGHLKDNAAVFGDPTKIR